MPELDETVEVVRPNMLAPEVPELGTITNPDAIAVLLEPNHAARLEPFFRADLSVGEAAAAAAVKPNTMYRWVQKWCAYGLLQQVGVRTKRGRPIKLYRTVTDTFFVPFEATRAPTLDAMLAELDAPFELKFRRQVATARQRAAGTWGYQIRVDEQRELWFRAAKDARQPLDFLGADEPAVVSAWHEGVYLTFEEAKALQLELYKLLMSLHEHPEARPGVQRYLFRVGLAPAR